MSDRTLDRLELMPVSSSVSRSTVSSVLELLEENLTPQNSLL